MEHLTILKNLIEKTKSAAGGPVELSAVELEIAQRAAIGYKRHLIMNNRFYPEEAMKLEKLIKFIEEALINDANNRNSL